MNMCMCRGLRSEYQSLDARNETSDIAKAKAIPTKCCTMSIASVLLRLDLPLSNPGEEVRVRVRI